VDLANGILVVGLKNMRRYKSVIVYLGLLVSLWSRLVGLGCGQEAASKAPPDPLDGPPFVTCKGWAIAEGATGKLLWGNHADQPMKAASTTKMMCLYVVLSLADRQPEVLEERLTISQLADKTDGSTADLRVGESLLVRDCLYGLMLPSGNDAGNALAEHFAERLEPPATGTASGPSHSRTNFIAEMNRTAARLGMKNTKYSSAFGDGIGEDNFTASPADLLLLAAAGMQHPRFQHYVSTRSHRCQVQRPEGDVREVTWTNTNQLLAIEGYDGVKTGTSTQAGSCLVSSCRRGEDHLLIAVLGSTSLDGRFIDTRNLFRWAWQQRGHRADSSTPPENPAAIK
jgi:D-alanyl-D-alanine carboxypeptidase (penicillin-binding protein 5/6)